MLQKLEDIKLPPKIIYAVQGEGRGHATRSIEIITHLESKKYDVHVFTGGDALSFFEGKSIQVTKITCFRYHYSKKGNLSLFQTAIHNFGKGAGLLLGMGNRFQSIKKKVAQINPQLIVSDFEPYTCRIANLFKIPLVSINHQHFFTECNLPRQSFFPKVISILIFQLFTRLLTGKPHKIIASSFYHFPQKLSSSALLIGPILNSQLKLLPTTSGSHITVYLKNPEYGFRLFSLFAQMRQVSFEVFSNFKSYLPSLLPAENIRYFNIHRESFIHSLATCRALISTAGNQVMGEAIYLRKPILAFPEPDVLEQELNAEALKLSQCGECYSLHEINLTVLRQFIQRLPQLVLKQTWNVISEKYDGTERAVMGIEKVLSFRLN